LNNVADWPTVFGFTSAMVKENDSAIGSKVEFFSGTF